MSKERETKYDLTTKEEGKELSPKIYLATICKTIQKYSLIKVKEFSPTRTTKNQYFFNPISGETKRISQGHGGTHITSKIPLKISSSLKSCEEKTLQFEGDLERTINLWRPEGLIYQGELTQLRSATEIYLGGLPFELVFDILYMGQSNMKQMEAEYKGPEETSDEKIEKLLTEFGKTLIERCLGLEITSNPKRRIISIQPEGLPKFQIAKILRGDKNSI